MKQNKVHSLIETLTNVIIKGGTATLLWILIRPYAVELPAIGVTAIFMVNSLIFGYIIRRCYNRGTKK